MSELAPNDPALICVDTKRGYVPGNVAIVSRRAADIVEFCQDNDISGAKLWDIAETLTEAEMHAFPTREDPELCAVAFGVMSAKLAQLGSAEELQCVAENLLRGPGRI